MKILSFDKLVQLRDAGYPQTLEPCDCAIGPRGKWLLFQGLGASNNEPPEGYVRVATLDGVLDAIETRWTNLNLTLAGGASYKLWSLVARNKFKSFGDVGGVEGTDRLEIAVELYLKLANDDRCKQPPSEAMQAAGVELPPAEEPDHASFGLSYYVTADGPILREASLLADDTKEHEALFLADLKGAALPVKGRELDEEERRRLAHHGIRYKNVGDEG